MDGKNGPATKSCFSCARTSTCRNRVMMSSRSLYLIAAATRLKGDNGRAEGQCRASRVHPGFVGECESWKSTNVLRVLPSLAAGRRSSMPLLPLACTASFEAPLGVATKGGLVGGAGAVSNGETVV